MRQTFLVRLVRVACRFPSARAIVFRAGGSPRGIQSADVVEIVSAMLADRRAGRTV